jgi:hypothetical protein
MSDIERFQEAWNNFIVTLATELHLYKALDALNRFFEKFNKNPR